MNRQIKFRGQNNGTGKWYYGYFTIHEQYPKIWVDNTPWDVVIESVGQFIGLKDKNGKDIYEGDILNYSNDSESGKATVEWDVGGFIIIWSEQKTDSPSILSPMFYFQCSNEWEIVGNIYETPELLK